MKHKGFFKNVLGLGLTLILGLFMASCGDDTTNNPTVKLYVTVDGFTADIAVDASSDVTSWHWEYGDGSVSDSIGSHTHVYSESGDYTIKCTVTNTDGLSAVASESITIATIEELLTAHTWVLSDAGSENGMGFHITPDLVNDYFISNVLAAIDGYQVDTVDINPDYDYTVKYNDEYTFQTNGSLDIKNNNETMIGWVYGDMTGIPDEKYVTTCRYVGINIVKDQDVSGATWTLHENEDLTLYTVIASPNDPSTGGVADTVEFKSIDYLEFNANGYLAIKDLTPLAVIKSIKSDEMVITLFYHGYIGDPANDGGLYARPSFLFNLTFKEK